MEIKIDGLREGVEEVQGREVGVAGATHSVSDCELCGRPLPTGRWSSGRADVMWSFKFSSGILGVHVCSKRRVGLARWAGWPAGGALLSWNVAKQHSRVSTSKASHGLHTGMRLYPPSHVLGSLIRRYSLFFGD